MNSKIYKFQYILYKIIDYHDLYTRHYMYVCVYKYMFMFNLVGYVSYVQYMRTVLCAEFSPFGGETTVTVHTVLPCGD